MPMQVEGTSYVTENANIFLNLPNSTFKTVQWVGLWVIPGGQMIILVVTSFCEMLVQLNKQLIWNEQCNWEQIQWFQLLKCISL